MTVKDWLVLNWKIGALSFGGGGRAIYYQEALVEKSTVLTEDEFHEGTTITQLVPGPNLVNLGMYIGLSVVGLKWMIAGFFLLCLPGSLLAVGILEAIDLNNPLVMRLFKGFSVGSVTFFILFVYRLSKGLRTGIGQNAPTRKIILRFFFACSIAACSLSGLSLFLVLPIAIPIAIIFEFQSWV
jgi:chromate transport protein ChrA